MLKLSVGAGAVFATLFIWVTGVRNPGAGVDEYWPALPFFVIITALAYIALEIPAYLNQVMTHYVDYQAKRLKAAEYAAARSNLYNPPPEPATIRVIDAPLSDHDRAWRHFLIRCTVEAARVGKLNFRNGMETFFGGNHAYWRAYVDRLVRWDKCWPPSGEGTMWRDGQDAALVLDLLAGGKLPPLPSGEWPPDLVGANNGGVENPANTGQTLENTVYASEHR